MTLRSAEKGAGKILGAEDLEDLEPRLTVPCIIDAVLRSHRLPFLVGISRTGHAALVARMKYASWATYYSGHSTLTRQFRSC